MIFALLSRRLRSWLLLSVLVPVAGKVLQEAGDRLEPRNPRAGRALRKSGDLARSMPGARGPAATGRA